MGRNQANMFKRLPGRVNAACDAGVSVEFSGSAVGVGGSELGTGIVVSVVGVIETAAVLL